MADADKIIEGHCPDCGPNRFADVVAQLTDDFSDDETGIWGATTYRTLRCRGCQSVYFQTDEIFSEYEEYTRHPVTGQLRRYRPHKIVYYPAPSKRTMPKWVYNIDIIDHNLYGLLTDIYGALNADLRVPAAIAVRTAFDRAAEMLGVDAAITFDEKLTELHEQGKISNEEKTNLRILINAGSAAAHQGWRPQPNELAIMISILEAFLHRSLVLPDEATQLAQKIPAKQKRKAKQAPTTHGGSPHADLASPQSPKNKSAAASTIASASSR